jgi:hypothetical protein
MTSGRKNSTVNSMFYNFCLILGVFIAPALSFFVIYSICSSFFFDALSSISFFSFAALIFLSSSFSVFAVFISSNCFLRATIYLS